MKPYYLLALCVLCFTVSFCQDSSYVHQDMPYILKVLTRGIPVTHQYLQDSAEGHVYLTMSIPDHDVAEISPSLSNYCTNFALVYRETILKPRHLPADSATVLLFKESDWRTPFYGYNVKFVNVPDNDTTALNLTTALLGLCPGSQYLFTSTDDLVITCKAPGYINEANKDNYRKYGVLVAGVCAKYFWNGKSSIRKITFVWLDPSGQPYATPYLIKEKNFVDWYKTYINS